MTTERTATETTEPVPAADGRALKELLRAHTLDDKWARELAELRATIPVARAEITRPGVR